MVGVPWGKILLSPRCWAYYLAGASISFSWYVYVTFLPSFLKDEFEVSYEQTEIMTGLPLLAGAVTCFLGGGLSDWLVQKTGSRRWGRSGVGMAGYGLAGLTTLGVAFLNRENASVWGVIALICLTTAIQDLALAAIWATAADIGQRYTGTVAGCLNTIGGIGGFLSPYMAPWLYKNWGWQGVFLCYAASYFFGALMWLFIDASKPVTQGHDKSVGDV
jgi:nitrate/nitrite transporter NarK